MSDVVIVGGGVIGLTIARELATASFSVTILERSSPGQEASWAGAGILPPTFPGAPDDPMTLLTRASHDLWPTLSQELLESTGIDNGFRPCGGIELNTSCVSVPPIQLENGSQSHTPWVWEKAGTLVEPLSNADLHHLEPRLQVDTEDAFRLPELCQVRNPRHLKAMVQRCQQLGVDLRAETEVFELSIEGRHVVSVRTAQEEIAADQFIVSAGAWSRRLLQDFPSAMSIRPIRGQMVLLEMEKPPLKHVIECGSRYLVPRPDGLVLIGATEEAVGFEKGNTAVAVEGLKQFAFELVPILQTARFVRAWSGLRPYRPSGRPIISQMPGLDNLYVAAGHFRAGLHLSPITGQIIKQLLLHESPAVPIEAFQLT